MPSDYFPSLEMVSKPLSQEEFAIVEKQYTREGKFVSIQTKFNYAWALIKNSDNASQREGVTILAQLYKDAPDRRREILYYLSVGCYKLGDYSSARKYSDILLSYEPENVQVNALRQEIEDKLNREGLMGFAIVGGAIAVGAAVLSQVLRRRN